MLSNTRQEVLRGKYPDTATLEAALYLDDKSKE